MPFVFFILFFFINFSFTHAKNDANKVFIYNWTNYIPTEVLKEFEKETGIHVIYDAYDSLEILETKLLMKSGYDVIFLPACPVLGRCIPIGIFLPLDKKSIPNSKGLDEELMKKLTQIDPKNRYGVPYLWGTTGISYDYKAITPLISQKALNSWSLLFNPEIIQNLKTLRPYILDSAIDVLQAALLYLGYSPTTLKYNEWDLAIQTIASVRPYITAFESARQIETLVDGHSKIIQSYSTYAHIAHVQGKHLTPPKDIRYVIPLEGAVIWFDMMAILKDAPHPKNAHIFINYILRPDVMAKITNSIQAANAVPSSYNLVKLSLMKDPTIFPDIKTMKRLHGDFIPPPKLMRYLLRQWLKIKMGYIK
jgi:putrescine transport system substrate-binding protein